MHRLNTSSTDSGDGHLENEQNTLFISHPPMQMLFGLFDFFDNNGAHDTDDRIAEKISSRSSDRRAVSVA